MNVWHSVVAKWFILFSTGMFGILWYVAWYVLAFESPSVHPTITKDERSYIELTAINMDEVSTIPFALVCL